VISGASVEGGRRGGKAYSKKVMNLGKKVKKRMG